MNPAKIKSDILGILRQVRGTKRQTFQETVTGADLEEFAEALTNYLLPWLLAPEPTPVAASELKEVYTVDLTFPDGATLTAAIYSKAEHAWAHRTAVLKVDYDDYGNESKSAAELLGLSGVSVRRLTVDPGYPSARGG